MSTTMLWTFMLGMVQKALKEEQTRGRDLCVGLYADSSADTHQ